MSVIFLYVAAIVAGALMLAAIVSWLIERHRERELAEWYEELGGRR